LKEFELGFRFLILVNCEQSLGETVTTEGETSVDDSLGAFDILFGWESVFGDIFVDEAGGKFIAFRGPLSFILKKISLDVGISELVLVSKGVGNIGHHIPNRIIEWLGEVIVPFVDKTIPESVQVSNVFFGSQVEKIATHVSIRILRSVSGDSVQRLVNVSNIMNQQS